ncbi:hypothetical protein [Urbifossiella limnaea]|nr:hypothetical protein [Urbifossiella limnaea]
MFNTLLKQEGLSLAEVRLLRHKDRSAAKGRSPYELWRDHPEKFHSYQSSQSLDNEPRLTGAYWAAFVVSPTDETLFAGLYSVAGKKVLDQDLPMPHKDGVDQAGSCHWYDLTLTDHLKDLAGRLVVAWGGGYLSWIQRADTQDKVVLELRAAFTEPAFPGYLNFIRPLSGLDSLHTGWVAALRAVKGVYVLTCPKTQEQYVGSASGADGFWGRWQDYVQNGHGGNVGLKSRDPSDYQVAILEVAGTAATPDDVLKMEALWKAKLRTKEMGLCKN